LRTNFFIPNLRISNFFIVCRLIFCLLLCLMLCGCSQDMWNGSRLKPLAASQVFMDGRSSRPLVADTVSRNAPVMETPFVSGMSGGKPTDDIFPIPVTRPLIDRGQQRYNIYCSPCHGKTGYGDGIIVQRGFPAPPSYHSNRLRQAPLGHFFDVITNGYGNMYSYNDRVSIPDRWAIIAYIRVLQRSQDATISDVPPQERQQLEGNSQ
jgi:mono/diheme cytochrome c family protein